MSEAARVEPDAKDCVEEERPLRLNRRDAALIAVLALTLLPFVAVVFGGLGRSNPLVVTTVTSLAIIAAALFLSWATETLETVIPVAGALAVLALIEVLPEYSFEVVLAWQKRIELAAASMTGSNRLLLGLGWPLIFFTAYVAARVRGQNFREVRLPPALASDVLFLALASLYAVFIYWKGTLALYDSMVLAGMYVAYVVRAMRHRGEAEDEEAGEDREPGLVGKLQALPLPRRAAAVLAFLAFGAFVIFFGAEPFINGIITTARASGISEFFLIQWVAPFLAEFPESLTAFLWAGTVVMVARGLGNLVSAKVNQWTLLIATIPLVYSLSVGHPAEIPLTQLSRDEILLTTAQTMLGVVILGRLRFTALDASLLLGLWIVQLAVPSLHTPMTIVYLVVAAGYVFLARSPMPLLNAALSRGPRAPADADEDGR